MLTDPYRWRCILCEAEGPRGAHGYEQHYSVWHRDARTYIDYLREARNEHGLNGADAYRWAHAAWNEYQKNQ